MNDIDTLMIHAERHLVESPEFRARLLACMARVGLYRVSRAELIHYRTEAAIKLLSTGMHRRDAQIIIRQRFGVSRATAYRLLDIALNKRQWRLFD